MRKSGGPHKERITFRRVEIAEIMCIAKRTVEFHIDNAQSKLGVRSRVEAAVKATILGLIDP
jgi:DNA-binding CsgD family transcriptional regulator